MRQAFRASGQPPLVSQVQAALPKAQHPKALTAELAGGDSLYVFIVFSSNYVIRLEKGLTSAEKQQSKQGKIVTGQSGYYLFSFGVCVGVCVHASLHVPTSWRMALTDKGSQGCMQGYRFTFSAPWHPDYLIEIVR